MYIFLATDQNTILFTNIKFTFSFGLTSFFSFICNKFVILLVKRMDVKKIKSYALIIKSFGHHQNLNSLARNILLGFFWTVKKVKIFSLITVKLH